MFSFKDERHVKTGGMKLLKAHAYWRMKGLSVDLVIWNEDHSATASSCWTILWE